MNAPSPSLRPLQVLAVALGIAIVGLFVTWVRLDPPPPVAPVLAAAAGDAAGAPATADSAVAVAPVQSPAPAPAATPAGTALASADASALLYGSVKRADGSLVKSGVFWLYRGGEHVGTQSLRDGTFVFAGLTAGEHRLDSRIDDELRFTRMVAVTAPRTRLDIQLPERWSLTVNAVTPDGAPLLETAQKQIKSPWLRRGLSAAAFAEPLGRDLPLSSYAEREIGLGRFVGNDPFRDREKSLPKQTIGMLTLPPDQPVHVALLLSTAVVAQMPATPGQAEVTFVLSVDALMAKSASVRVRVVDGNGAPVVGANIALNDAQSGGGGTKSDAEGRVALSHLKEGRLDFEVSHKDLRAPPVRIDVHAGADLDLGDITLRPAVQVELDFDNFGGKGGVRAYWLDAPPRAGWHTDEIHLTAENRGSGKASLFPGRYGLLATSPSGVAFVEIDANTPSSQPIHFDLQPGAPLRIEHRSELGSLQLTMRDRKGLVVYQRELSGTGEFTVKLPPGEYEAESGDGSTPGTRRAITLGRDGATLTIP